MSIDPEKAKTVSDTFHQEKTGRKDFVNIDTRFTGSIQNLPRVQSRDSEVFGKYGYNTIQNIEQVYNSKTSAWDDVSRAYKGMLELAAVGFDDTFALGAFKNPNNAVEFMDIMNTYSSSREGFTGGFSNTLISSGYTVGITLAIAAEQIALSSATGLATLAGRGTQAGRATQYGADLVQSADAFADSYLNFFKYARSKGTIDLAKSQRWSAEWFKARGLKAGGAVGEMFKGALPASNTANYFRAATGGQALNQITRGTLLAGALYQDARKFYLAHSESLLESDMIKNESIQELTARWHSENPGEIMPENVYQDINSLVTDTSNKVYWSNFLTIYVSNALLFDHMLKPLSKMQSAASKQIVKQNALFTTTKEGGKLTIAATKTPYQLYKESWNLIKQSKNLTLGKAVTKGIDFTASSSMEGFQEIAQDIISSAGKKYADGMFNSGTGSYFEALYDSLGDWDSHSFWSGFFIGSFAAPVNLAVSAINETAFGGSSTMWSSKSAAIEETQYQQRVKIAEDLTEFYNKTGTFANEMANNFLGPSLSSRETLVKNMLSEDTKKAKDAESRIFRNNVEKMLELNAEGELLDWLSEMNGYTVDELNGALNRTDITEENKSEVLQDISDYADRIKNYRAVYNEMQAETRLDNPIDKSELTEEARAKDPQEFLKKVIEYTAWETMRSNYLFNREAVKDFENRIARMRMSVKQGLTALSNSDLDALLVDDLLESELDMLKSAVESNKEYVTEEKDFTTSKEHKRTEKKYEILNKYAEAKSKLFDASLDLSDQESQKLVEQMQEAFSEYVSLIEGIELTESRKEINNKKFVYILDILNNSVEQEAAQEHALSLLNSNYRNDFFEQTKKELEYLEENKKEIIELSIKALQEKFAAADLTKELLEENLIFHLDEIDDLIQKGIMPSKIYNASTNEEATKEEYDKAKEIISKAYDNLTGKKITIQSRPSMASKKFDGDNRTSTQLMASTANVNDIFSLINYLISSDQTTKVEKAILTELLDNVTDEDNIQVVVGDNLGQAVGINLDSDGKLVLNLDVRHASSDYTIDKGPGESKARTYRFESVAISGLINYYMQNKMKTDSVFANMVDSFYTAAKADMLEYLQQTQPSENWTAEKVDELAMFSSPTVFLSEALHNEQFRDLLDSIKDPSSSVDQSILETLQEEIDSVLSENLADPTLLARANTLALSSFMELSETDVEVKSEPVSAVKANSDMTIEELGISQEEWDGLTEEEKEDIKNCR